MILFFALVPKIVTFNMYCLEINPSIYKSISPSNIRTYTHIHSFYSHVSFLSLLFYCWFYYVLFYYFAINNKIILNLYFWILYSNQWINDLLLCGICGHTDTSVVCVTLYSFSCYYLLWLSSLMQTHFWERWTHFRDGTYSSETKVKIENINANTPECCWTLSYIFNLASKKVIILVLQHFEQLVRQA